jgi:riboflavin synthase alpha subunit
MFTGLVEGVGSVVVARKVGPAMDLEVDLGAIGTGLAAGDSIALSGVCCTATERRGTAATFWLSPETLQRTWFGTLGPHGLAAGTRLNLERCVRAGQPLGGHIVQGHVDGVGRVVREVTEAGGTLEIELPAALLRYCVEKGSIALEGVSLTIAGLTGYRIAIAIIPHTAVHTTLGSRRAGEPVNVEVDVLAKYVERLLGSRAAAGG